MSVRNTENAGIQNAGIQPIHRMDGWVHATERVDSVDIILPSDSGYLTIARKALRVCRIDTRSLVISDLSEVAGNHLDETPEPGVELGKPFTVIDLNDGETIYFGRRPDLNPSHLPLLERPVVSNVHFSITPRIGEAGLFLHFKDENSRNGSHALYNERDQTELTTASFVDVPTELRV